MAVKTKINIDKEKLKAPIIKDILWCGGFFILGLMLSLGSLIGSIRPFGISIVSVAKKKHLPFALAGAVVGYLTGGLNEQTARYIAALLIAAIGALAADIFDLRHSISFIMTVAFLANVSTGIILNIHESSESNEYLITIASAILSSGGVFFFYNSLNSSYKRLRLKALPISEIVIQHISLIGRAFSLSLL